MVLLVWKTVSGDSQLILTFSWDGHGMISQSVTLFQPQHGWSPGRSGSSHFFTHSYSIPSTYPIWFKPLCHLRQFLDALLCIRQSKDQWRHPTAHPTDGSHTPANAQIHKTIHTAISGLKPGISMQFYCHIEDFVLRNSTKRNKCNLWNLVKLSRSATAVLQATLQVTSSWNGTTDTCISRCQTRSKSRYTKGASSAISLVFMLNTQVHLCISEQKLLLVSSY